MNEHSFLVEDQKFVAPIRCSECDDKRVTRANVASNLRAWGYFSEKSRRPTMVHRGMGCYLIMAAKLKVFVGRTAAAIEYSVIAAGLSLVMIMVVNGLTDLNAAFSSVVTH